MRSNDSAINRTIECDFKSLVNLRSEMEVKYIGMTFKKRAEGMAKGSRKEQMLGLRRDAFRIV